MVLRYTNIEGEYIMLLSMVFMESLIWSLLWIFVVIVLVRKFPFMISHDYPIDVQKVANIGVPTKEEKLKGNVFGAISFSILLLLPILFVLFHHSSASSFLSIFMHIWVICITWNVVDLIIVDWLFICKLLYRPFLLPGSEGYEGNRNYGYHFKGFVKGAFMMSFMALILSVISYLILQFM